MKKLLSNLKYFWKNSNGFKGGFFYVIGYSVLFCIAALLAFIYFPLSDKTFVWSSDGITQHLPFFRYYLNYFSEILSTFFSTGQLIIPQWDFAIGLGGDILTSFCNSGIFDPINYLGLLFQHFFDTYHVYALLTLLRIYLAGLAFSAFCFSFRLNKNHILIGSLTYSFCGFTLYAAVRHPFFVNPMIYLPLLLLGFEWILKKKKPYLFIGITALSLVVNFYFFFMMTIMLFIYALVRFFSYYAPEERKGKFWRLVGRSTGHYITGIFISAWFLLPLISAILTSTRGEGVEISSLLFYDANYYFKLFLGFTSPISTSDYWSVLGFTPFALIAVVILFNRTGRKYRSLKQLFLFSFLGLCIPAIGLIFSAMTYVSNRWCFAFAFVVSYILVAMLPEFNRLTKKDWAGIGILLTIPSLCCLLIPTLNSNMYSLGILLTIVAIAILLLLNGKIKLNEKAKAFFKHSVSIVLIICTLFSIALSARFRYHIYYGNYVSEFVSDTNRNGITEDVSKLTTSVALIDKIEDDSFYRVEIDDTPEVNGSLNRGYYGTSMFYSMFHDGIDDYYHNLGLTSQTTSLYYKGLTQRSTLLNLSSVKYLITKENKASVMPDNMTEIARKNGSVLYRNENALPIGFTYDSYITQEDLESFTPVQLQELMLYTAIVKEPQDNLSVSQITADTLSHVVEVPYSITSMSGLTCEDNIIKVNKANATLKLTFQTPAYCENYLSFENMDIKYYNPLKNPERFLSKDATKDAYLKLYKSNLNYKESADSLRLTVSTSHISDFAIIPSASNNWSTNAHDFAFHLGYNKEPLTSVTIQFSKICDVSLDDLKIYSIPLETSTQMVETRKENVLENVKISTNSITGTITVDKPELLCLTIPYHEGWHATVDGKEVPLISVNILYSGIMLDAGSHSIELHYESPYLKFGAFISAITLCLFILIRVILFILYQTKKKRS